MNRTSGYTLRKNRRTASLAGQALMETAIVACIDKTRRNRQDWLRKTFGGRECGYYDDASSIVVGGRKR